MTTNLTTRIAEGIAESFRGDCLAGSEDADRMAKAALSIVVEELREVEEALDITTHALEIANDWGAPDAYDIKVPESWNDTKNPNSVEPDWPTLIGILDKARAALTRLQAISKEVL